MNKRGFTLIEILVTVTIIGLLSTMATVFLKSAREKSKIAKAQHEIDQIYTALGIMANDCDVWPGNQPKNQIGTIGNEICGDAGCLASITSNVANIMASDGTCSSWSGPYMKNIPLDAWGNEYFFDTTYQINTVTGEPCPGGPPVPATCQNVVVIGSYGPDGVGRNQFTGDDIIKVIFK